MAATAQKIAIVGAGPVGSLAALYAAERGYQVELYELRPGTLFVFLSARIAGGPGLGVANLSRAPSPFPARFVNAKSCH